MDKSAVRKIGSVFLMSAVLMTSTAILPLSSFAQTTDTKQDKKQTTKSDKKDKKAKETPAATPQTQTQTGSKLSVKEDPSQIGKRNINSGSDKFFGWLGGSKEKEAALGRQLAAEVEQQAKLVDDPVINEYVNRVGQNVVLHSDAKVPFTIKVIDTDEVNAFALPGGYFFVNKGLILAADNESELAGVMAHEIAHVAARHAMENQGKASAMNYGMLAGILFGGGIISNVLYNGGGILGSLGMLKFSRGAEEEADRLGVQYLYAAGYDPNGMATMFEKLASQNKKKPGAVARMFSSHPQPTNRREASVALVARFPEREEYVISTSEFQRVKNRLLKTTNARSTVAIDIDEGTPGKPTLKRRAPDASDDSTSTGTGTGTSSSGSSSSRGNSTNSGGSTQPSGPPQLKRRGAEPTTSPTPNN
jgi:beta-barrel assembly-enhancing protease